MAEKLPINEGQTQQAQPKPAQATSQAQIEKAKPFDMIIQDLSRATGQDVNEIKQKVMYILLNNKDAFMKAARTPEGKLSAINALMYIMRTGLSPTAGQIYIVPYQNRKEGYVNIDVQIGYKGLLKLLAQHPEIEAIDFGVVREGDEFEWYVDPIEGGFRMKYKCKSSYKDPITHAWAYAKLKNGTVVGYVADRNEIEQARKLSRGADSPSSPWNQFYEAMAAKTALRRLARKLPLSDSIAEIVEWEERQLGLSAKEMADE